MKLRSKLIYAFGAMLLLVVVTAASGWFAMKNMDKLSRQLASVDNSMFAMQRSQLNTLRFTSNNTPKDAEEAISSIGSSRSFLQTAMTLMDTPDQRKLAQEAMTGIDSFEANIKTLVLHSNNAAAITGKMRGLTEEIATTFADTLKRLEAALLEQFNENGLLAFSLANKAESNFYSMRIAVVYYMNSPSDASAKKAQDELSLVREQCVAAEKSFTRQANKDAVMQVIKLIDSYNTLLQDYKATYALLGQASIQSNTLGMQVAAACNNLSSAAEVLILESEQEANAISMLVLLAAMIMGIGITYMLTRNILSQLGKDPGELATVANRVSEGDFNIDDGSPQVGVYGNIVHMVAVLKEHIENAQNAAASAKVESERAVEAMKAADLASADAQAKRDSILSAADKLEEVANIVSSAAEELSAQIEQSERGAAEQASRVGETATAMEQMNATVLEVARNAASANVGGAAMRDKAITGATVVDSSVNGVQKARTDALALKDDMNALSEQAQSIGQIMNVISDIADQTNLLALNAAIEAARAGEAGRGFAVVADEVRKLAEKTMQSTTDVGNAIRTIQESATKNMAQVDATVKNIEFSTEEAEKSGLALREIVEMVDMAVAQVSSIATASEEQSATSEEINNSIAQVNTIASETARAMQEAAQAVSDLSHQAQVLSQLIEDLKRS